MRFALTVAFVLFWHFCSSQFFGNKQVITDMAEGANQVYAVDLDGDGDVDVLSSSSTDGKIAWYENDGTGGFGTQQIISNTLYDAQTVFAEDLDGDDDMDVIAASDELGLVEWYENDGTGVFSPGHTISDSVLGASCVFAADIDNDGDMDVIAGFYMYSSTINPNPNQISWYANDGTGVFGAEQLIVSGEVYGVKSIYVSDLDGDGDLDILAGSLYENDIAWLENLGSGTFGPLHVIQEDYYSDYTIDVYSADLDNDGDLDVLAASYSLGIVSWYENEGGGNFGSRNIIPSDAVDGAFSVHAADFDLDGDMDVISCYTGDASSDNYVGWNENLGNGNFSSPKLINTSGVHNTSVFTADLDGDGDMDALSTFSNNGVVAWYENRIVGGCTNVTACNFDPIVTKEDGSCYFMGDTCDDGNPETLDEEIQINCQCFSPMPEDFDGDGVVGSSDLAELLSSFGTICTLGESCAEDLNEDGIITVQDLAQLLSQFGG